MSSGVRLTFDVRLLQQRTLTAFFILQLAVDEASSKPTVSSVAFVLSLLDAFCLFGCVTATTQQKQSCENHTLRAPGYDVIYFCPIVCVVGNI